MAFFAGENYNITYSFIPSFGRENYEFWKVKMKTLLLSKGLQSIVEKGFSEPSDESQLTNAQRERLEASRMKDAKALSKIQNGVSIAIFP